MSDTFDEAALKQALLQIDKEQTILRDLLIHLQSKGFTNFSKDNMDLIEEKIRKYVENLRPTNVVSLDEFRKVNRCLELTDGNFACTQPDGSVVIAQKKVTFGGKSKRKPKASALLH